MDLQRQATVMVTEKKKKRAGVKKYRFSKVQDEQYKENVWLPVSHLHNRNISGKNN